MDPALRTGGMNDMAGLAAEVIAPLAQLTFQEMNLCYAISGTPVAETLHPAWQILPDGLGLPLPVQVMDAALVALTAKAAVPSSPHSGIRVPIGTRAGQPFYFELGDDAGVFSALIGGTTGSGKSVLLHNIILGIIEHYTPQQVCMVLMDLKEGIEFSVYDGHPSVQHFLHGTDAGQALAALQQVQTTISGRGTLFRENGVNSIARYNEAFPAEPLPRIVVVVDEFQRLFEGGFKEVGQINRLLEDLAKRGRSFGIHLIMASQGLAGSPFDKSARNVFGLRIVLRISAAECPNFFDDPTNAAPASFEKAGLAIYNTQGGQRKANKEIRVTELNPEDIPSHISLATTANVASKCITVDDAS
jgi:hypothetical protein